MSSQHSISSPLLSVQALQINYRVVYRGTQRLLPAVNAVSFAIERGESLGVVGESGSGKSSIARALLRLIDAQSGSVLFRGGDLLRLSGRQLHAMRRHLQMIFQDPLASLDPRMQIADIIAEPLLAFESRLSAAQRSRSVLAAMTAVGLDVGHLQRYPHEFSGGQAQRIGIARALIAQPDLIVGDEPLSALDVSIKSQISNLLKDLQQRRQLSLLFISHDLAAVRFLCDRVLVLYLGRMMELAPAQLLYARPLHPYTRALFEAIPIADPDIQPARLTHSMAGEPPSALAPPPGCVFQTRCPHVIAICRRQIPAWEAVGEGRHVACHRWREI